MLRKLLFVSTLVSIFFIFNSLALAQWGAPDAAPPNPGTSAVPLNTSSVTQAKTGDLNIGGVLGTNGFQFNNFPAWGKVLMSNDAFGTAAWVATSTLGLGGGGGSQTPWTSNINAAGFSLFGNSTAGGDLTLDSTSNATKGDIVLNPTGGNVGVGTVTPGAKLEVNAISSHIKLSGATSDGVVQVAGNNMSLGSWSSGGNLKVDLTNGNVGIGTSGGPLAALEIKNSQSWNTTYGNNLRIFGAGTNWPSIRFFSENSNKTAVLMSNGGGLGVFVNGTGEGNPPGGLVFEVKPNSDAYFRGNLGVGNTITPDATLNVVGTMHVTGASSFDTNPLRCVTNTQILTTVSGDNYTTAYCSAGYVVTGGGFFMNRAGGVPAVRSNPVSSPDGWHAGVNDPGSSTLTVYARCCKMN